MRKIVFFLITFILVFRQLSVNVYSQSNSTSVDALIESTQNDSVRIKVLIKLSQDYIYSDPAKGFDFAINALILATHLNNKSGMASANNNLGDFYWYKYDYVSSELYYTQALKIFKELADSSKIANCYRNLGWIYNNRGDHLVSLEYHIKALKIDKCLNLNRKLAYNYNDIGIGYANIKLYDSAMINYCMALNIADSLKEPNLFCGTYINMSELYDRMGFTSLAIDNAFMSMNYAKKINNRGYLVDINSKLSDLYKKLQNYDSALLYSEESIKLAQEINDKSWVNTNLKNLASIYALQHRYDKGLYYIERANSMSDSIDEEINSRLYAEMLKKYESENKMFAIQNLKKDKEITEQKLLQGKKIKVYLLGFGILVVGFVIFLMRNNKQRERINLELTKASKQIKEKNEEIMDSIAYSKRIQDVCLPSEELRHKLFNNSFLFFKPKDIVSGDFYWYTEKDGKRIIACCDCTGHGVPGALMSMIGINSLNRIVNGKGITSTDEILKTLHYEISKTLKQDDQIYINDGIDVSIVCFNSENEIEYSGANSPLWIVKKTADGLSELIEIEPDKLSIGIVNVADTIKYTKHSITLQKEDCIYLFSDGVFDQFGGPEGKKYGSGGFKKLIGQLATYTPEEQSIRIAEEMNQWIGNTEQVDDISVIGIKI